MHRSASVPITHSTRTAGLAGFALLAVLWLLPTGRALADNDDFNDNTRNTVRWGSSDIGTAGGLVEANGRLEYRNGTLGGLYTVWGWQTLLPFGQDWETRVNVNLPALSFGADGYAGVGLYVLNGADPSDLVALEFEIGKDGGPVYRGFSSIINVNGVDMPGLDLFAPTVSTSATFRARWVAATARLHLEYDADGPANGEVWTVLRTFDPAATWGMSSGNFQVGIGGFSENRVIASGDGVSLDDFTGTIGTPATITTNPRSQSVAVGGTATLSVSATGSGTLSYRWFKDGVVINGETGNTLTRANATAADTGQYQVEVTNAGGTSPSNGALLVVLPAGGTGFAGSDNFNDNTRDPALWGSTDFAPAGSLVESNGRLEFRNSTTNEVDAAWGWHRSLAPYTQDWEARVLVNLPSLSFPVGGGYAGLGLYVLNSADPGDSVTLELETGRVGGNNYRQFLSVLNVDDVDMPAQDLFGSTASTSAALRVRWVAATARLHVEYDADGPANGEVWTLLRTFDPAATWGMSSGPFLIGIGGFSENRIITSGDGVSLDDFAASTAAPAPTINTQPQSQVVTATSNVTFTVAATGSGLTYQWRKGVVDIGGATSDTLTLNSVTRAASGAYSVLVTSGGSSTPSSAATLRVIVPQQLQTPQRGGGGQFQLLFTDPDTAVGGDLSRFEVHHTANFLGASTVWVTNSGSFTLSSGKILFDDTGSVGTARRFYRVIEK